jgi:probable HAF family extracellular repeat protein
VDLRLDGCSAERGGASMGVEDGVCVGPAVENADDVTACSADDAGGTVPELPAQGIGLRVGEGPVMQRSWNHRTRSPAKQTGEAHAFRRAANGDVTTVDVPGAQLTGPFGINNRGTVVGTYSDADSVNQAYVMERGEVTTLVPPDAPDDPARAQVVATDINDRGQVVGCYADDNGTYHGFLYDQGRFTRIDPPGGADVAEYATTCPFGINNSGHVVGQYVDAAGVLHGYLWQRTRGFETIDPPPGAPTVGPTGVTGKPWPWTSTTAGDILLPIPGGLYKGRAVPIGR